VKRSLLIAMIKFRVRVNDEDVAQLVRRPIWERVMMAKQ
jgi:hypothetical protein